MRDFVSVNITLEKGTIGAKPPAFCAWVLDLLGFDATTDIFDDVFPGGGSFSRVRDDRYAATHCGQTELRLEP